eukprot:5682143-Pleurochrysis_carterae.AAC.1
MVGDFCPLGGGPTAAIVPKRLFSRLRIRRCGRECEGAAGAPAAKVGTVFAGCSGSEEHGRRSSTTT